MKTIQIDDKHYNAETIPESVKKLINDINIIDAETMKLQVQASINNIAKDALINALKLEIPNLEEVQVPEAE